VAPTVLASATLLVRERVVGPAPSFVHTKHRSPNDWSALLKLTTFQANAWSAFFKLTTFLGQDFSSLRTRSERFMPYDKHQPTSDNQFVKNWLTSTA
jgi:hypothetical protein